MTSPATLNVLKARHFVENYAPILIQIRVIVEAVATNATQMKYAMQELAFPIYNLKQELH